MATMREIKRRKDSIQSTEQITKAMKLVSTVKLQKSRTRAENAKPYFQYMYATIASMLAKSGNINHPYLQKNDSEKKAVITITSNRGLAGGYNSNIVKLITASDLKKEDVRIYSLGRKGRDGLAGKGYSIAADYSDVIEAPLYSDAVEIGRAVLDAYEKGEIGEIYLAYTYFKNTVVHEPRLLKLLPVDNIESEAGEDDLLQMNYDTEAEDDPEEIIGEIIPKYLYSMIYGAALESVASENGARMQAMDSATSNAEEMIAHLGLQYNRARQASITQELTEIIAGSEAIS